MAFQTRRGGDPLFDSDMQATIERRGKELAGLALIVLGLLTSLMFLSYSPDDPSWLSVHDAPVQNWLGRLGAAVAAPLFMVIGSGSWGLSVILLVWGARFALHWGEDRAIGRLIFAPIWIAMLAVFASTLVPDQDWTHRFGMGGLFGDTVLGTVLGVVPFGPSLGLKMISLGIGLPMLALGLFVTGFDGVEIRRIARACLIGLIMIYAGIANILGRGAVGALKTAATLQDRNRTRRETRRIAAEEQARWDAEHPEDEEDAFVEEDDWSAPEPTISARRTLASRIPGLVRRAEHETYVAQEPATELPVEPEEEPVYDAHNLHPEDDRIKARIAEIVRSRTRNEPVPTQPAPEDKPLTRGRGRGPRPLVFNPQHRAEPPVSAPARTLPAEPPLTAAQVATPAQVAAPSQPAPRHSQPDHRIAPASVPPRAAAPVLERHTAPKSTLGEARFVEVPEDSYPEEDVDDRYQSEEDAGYGNYDYDEMPVAEDAAYPEDTYAEEAYDDGYDDLPYEAPQPEQRLPVAEPRGPRVQHNIRKPVTTSTRARLEAQPSLQFEDRHADYELPPLALLADPSNVERHVLSDEALEENARMLENVLDDYGVKGEIVSVRPGPVVTMYELEPAPGLKASRVIGLADDIARSMSALSARVSTVPGRSVIGIELPNDKREMVSFREILSTRDYGDGNQKLPLALGKDIGGDPVVANLAKMPHLLIAGTTGSGKSVAINTMILSLLYKLSPDDLRLVMIDPKMLELSVYDGIPHLLSPVVTDPKKAVVALKWVVGEMEERYRKMSKMGVRNIDGYNGRVADAVSKGEMFSRTVQTGFDDDTGDPVFETEEFAPKKMPYIVVIVDEMADLMMVAGKEIEACIQRLAQMARASGIHLIMATQRPSVDVITGTIKANFPTRISFQVTSKIDSRTILGEMGAEQLLGMGDMLYMAGGSKIIRAHGPFVSDEEVEEIVNHLKTFGPPDYVGGVVDGPDEEKADDIDAVLGLNTGGNTDGEDALYDQAVAVVIKDRKCSTSYIQRKLGIGYNKAARLVEQMEDNGLVTPANHVGKREILVPEQA
ncbi:DNA translocase FtsK 4TM domain-containing protein [Pseudooceanicola sp. C21-150M6]|uniref:DNA translocase FtsK n=1 Tax=Pseudooceanicola sp. C21-150M6 TaxID=3434355 RepID=UPI003D7F24E2